MSLGLLHSSLLLGRFSRVLKKFELFLEFIFTYRHFYNTNIIFSLKRDFSSLNRDDISNERINRSRSGIGMTWVDGLEDK